MPRYSPDNVILKLNDYEISGFSDAGDQITLVEDSELGAYTHGTGDSVFVASGKKGGTLTLKLLQNTPSNKHLSALRNQQRNSLKDFKPLSLYIKDLINGDEAVGFEGYFSAAKNLTRGNQHNDETWVIQFKNVKIDNAEGA